MIVVFSMFVFAGCAGINNKGDKRFTYDWKAYSMTNNGSTMYIHETDPVIPEFSSSDGKTCIFTNNGKSLSGTIEKKEGNRFNIKLETDVIIEAEISEDTLTLSFNRGQIILVFKAD